MNRSIANLLLLLAGAIWGAGFVAQKSAMDDLNPFMFIGCRFLLAAAVFCPLAIREVARTHNRLDRSNFYRFVILGLVFFTAACLQQTGLLNTSITNTGFLTGLYVVLVPLISLIAFRTPPSASLWPLSLICLFGIWLMSGGELTTSTWGDALILIGAVGWAIHVILVSRFAVRSGLPLTMATFQFFVAGVMGLSCGFIWALAASDYDSIGPDAIWGAGPEILYAGIVSGGVAFTLQAVAQRHTSPSVAAILMSSESLFAALFGAWLLNERLTIAGYCGCGLIFLAIVSTEVMTLYNDRKKKIRESTKTAEA